MAFVIALILVTVSIFVTFAFVAFVHDYLIFFPGITGDMMSIVEWWHPFVFILIVGICWFLAGLSQSMFTINGSGVKLFGHTLSPNGHIATKWICMLYLPLIPVDSYEITAQQDSGLQSEYIMVRLEELHWHQVYETAFKGVLGLLGVTLTFALIFNAIFLAI